MISPRCRPAVETSPEYAQALAKRGINDVKKVVATPLTVGYFDGKDGLAQDKRLLKIVSYLNVDDGNYWAHPIEGLVAIVDLEQKKLIKIEDEALIPVPMKPTPYDGRGRKGVAVKPLEIIEPEGKNYTITGNSIHWQNWDFHVRLDSRVGPILSTVTYDDKGKKRKIMYEGSLGGMIVPYGDPDVGWYFKAYLDSGDYGMGTLTSPIARGKDAPENAVLLDATIADYTGAPTAIPRAMAVFERYAGPEYKHQEMGQPNLSTERRELVVRWISTVGNYDYIFDWVFQQNGTIGIDAGATGIEAVKGVKSRTMHEDTAKEDTRYGTLLDHNIVGTTHQHIYNFRLDMDVDGEQQLAGGSEPGGAAERPWRPAHQHHADRNPRGQHRTAGGAEIRPVDRAPADQLQQGKQGRQPGVLPVDSVCRRHAPGGQGRQLRQGRMAVPPPELHGQAAVGDAIQPGGKVPGRQVPEPLGQRLGTGAIHPG